MSVNVLDQCDEEKIQHIKMTNSKGRWDVEIDGVFDGPRYSNRVYGSGSSVWPSAAIEAALEDWRSNARGENDE